MTKTICRSCGGKTVVVDVNNRFWKNIVTIQCICCSKKKRILVTKHRSIDEYLYSN